MGALQFPRIVRSPAWQLFYEETDQAGVSCVKCKLCDKRPSAGTGTSGIWGHVNNCHAKEHALAKRSGNVSMTTCIADSLAACADKTKDALARDESSQLHHFAALWIAKCGRSEQIVDDPELQMLISSILQKCKSKYRYRLPCRQTLNHHLSQLGAEGKAAARVFCRQLLESGVKISITGDLWSDSGMGLFGMYAHGIVEESVEVNGEEVVTWTVRKVLIGLVPCAAERHTNVQIVSWTQKALSDIGPTYSALTRQEGQEPQDAADSAEVDSDGPPLTDDELKMLGLNSRATSDDFVFKKVRDNGANMRAAWTMDSNDFTHSAPCACHTLELCTLSIT